MRTSIRFARASVSNSVRIHESEVESVLVQIRHDLCGGFRGRLRIGFRNDAARTKTRIECLAEFRVLVAEMKRVEHAVRALRLCDGD
jgi:hypothetical protein